MHFHSSKKQRCLIFPGLMATATGTSPQPATMEALKGGIRALMEKREGMEAEIEAATSRLDAAGVGMHGILVDKEVGTG